MIKLICTLILAICFPSNVFALDAPTVTATAISYNQINLTWAAVSNPGWGYKVEIQSDGDSRYSTWTDYTALLKNGFGYLHYWVTEGHYLDRANGSGSLTPASDTCIDHSEACGTHAQLMVFGLKYSTLYNFRVRSYGKTDAGVATYSSYSSTASATTATPGTIRHVKQGGSGDGTSEVNAWGALSSANGVEAGTLVIVHEGTLSANSFNPSNSGTKTSRIVIQADPGETVTVTAPAGTMITLDTDYVVFDGFAFTDSAGTSGQVINITGNRNIIANTTLDGPSPSANGYTPYIGGGGVGASNCNVLENNYWKEYGSMDGTSGGPLAIFGDYNVVSNSHNEKGGHDTLIVRGKRNAMLNSLFDGGWGMPIELQGTGSYVSQYNLVEGCFLKDASTAGSPWGGSYKPNIEISSQNNTVRRNIMLDGSSHGIEVSRVLQDANYNLIHNNVIYGNAGTGFDFMNTAGLDNNLIGNNIIYLNGGAWDTSPTYIVLRGTITNTTFDSNIILHSTGASATIIYYGSNQTVAYADANWSTYFTGNYTSAPTFLDAGSNDFHLQSSSYGLALSESVTDATWGSVISAGESLGAFKYYAITGSASTTTTLTGGTIQGGNLQ